MKVAFDLDGTITAHPEVLIDLMHTLIRGGAEVLILTAAAGEFKPADRPSEVQRRVAEMGIHDIPIVCCEARDKPKWCHKLKVDLLLDDTPFDLHKTVQLLPQSALRAAASTLLMK